MTFVVGPPIVQKWWLWCETLGSNAIATISNSLTIHKFTQFSLQRRSWFSTVHVYCVHIFFGRGGVGFGATVPSCRYALKNVHDELCYEPVSLWGRGAQAWVVLRQRLDEPGTHWMNLARTGWTKLSEILWFFKNYLYILLFLKWKKSNHVI